MLIRAVACLSVVAAVAGCADASGSLSSYIPKMPSFSEAPKVADAVYGPPGAPLIDPDRINRLDSRLDSKSASIDCVLSDNSRKAISYANAYYDANVDGFSTLPNVTPEVEKMSDPRKVVDNVLTTLRPSFKSARLVDSMAQVDRAGGAIPCVIDVEMKFAQNYYGDENSRVKIRVYYLSGNGDLLGRAYGFGRATQERGWPPATDARQATRIAVDSLNFEVKALVP